MSAGKFVVQVNGHTATTEQLEPLAFAGYAHFTAMQIRGGKVRGLDLHLQRLRAASNELFGRALPENQMRYYLREALKAGPADLSLSVTVYSPAGEFTAAGTEIDPEVLVRTGPPASGPQGLLKLSIVEYERFIPGIKHVGEVAKTYLLRKAVEQDFDDAAFIDRRGRLSEGTIWNLAFWDRDSVVWPEAEILAGTTMGIVRRQLDKIGIMQSVKEVTPPDLTKFAGCVVMNSWTPGVTVSRIGSVHLPHATSFLKLLHRVYNAEPLTSP